MKLMIDMVHHNPGEPPFRSAFLDPACLVEHGYTGQVLLHINCIATFRALGEDFFPAGSDERAWLDLLTVKIERELRAAKTLGLQVFYHMDMFVLPKRLVERFRNRLCDCHGRISLEQEFTFEVYRILFDELFARYPLLDGFIIRHGENYLYDMPFHVGNEPIPLHGPLVEPERGHDRFVRLIHFLRGEICVRHNKTLIFRTWDYLPNKFHANRDYYLAVTDRIEPHPKLFFSIKHTAMDFFRRVKVNEALGQGRHPQIVEVQCQREYEGKGAYPNYVMDGIINGFEENTKCVGLKHLIRSPLIQGVYTWSRGGGWYGPHLQEEFWPALNVYVISRWACHPHDTEEEIFHEFCRDRLGLNDEDTAAFRLLCVLSARAVLKGRYCEPWDRMLGESQTPTALWMRDDRLGGLDQLSIIFAYLQRHGVLNVALQEKAEAVELWEQIAAVFEGIQFRDPSLQQRLATSIQYGLRLFRVVAAGWQVMATGYTGGRRCVLDRVAIDRAIAVYDETWKSYRQVAELPGAATLYRGDYFSLPGQPPAPGLDATVSAKRERRNFDANITGETPFLGFHATMNDSPKNHISRIANL